MNIGTYVGRYGRLIVMLDSAAKRPTGTESEERKLQLSEQKRGIT
jgi:hypothetical protein